MGKIVSFMLLSTVKLIIKNQFGSQFGSKPDMQSEVYALF
jgi:hypothetical protein